MSFLLRFESPFLGTALDRIDKRLFSHLLGIIDRHYFGRLVRETQAEKGAKGFTCWEQLVAMLFCQLAQARSLREIVGGLQCCEGKLQNLGVESAPGRSTLAYANAQGPWKLFEGLFYHLLEVCRGWRPARSSVSKTNS